MLTNQTVAALSPASPSLCSFHFPSTQEQTQRLQPTSLSSQVFILSFETGSCNVTQTGLKLTVFLSYFLSTRVASPVLDYKHGHRAQLPEAAHTHLILAFGRQGQVTLCEFEINLIYSFQTARAT